MNVELTKETLETQQWTCSEYSRHSVIMLCARHIELKSIPCRIRLWTIFAPSSVCLWRQRRVRLIFSGITTDCCRCLILVASCRPERDIREHLWCSMCTWHQSSYFDFQIQLLPISFFPFPSANRSNFAAFVLSFLHPMPCK